MVELSTIRRHYLFFIDFVFIFFFIFFFVKCQANASINELSELVIKVKGDPEVYLVKLNNNLDAVKVLKSYKTNSELEYVELNYKVKAAAFPNDPEYGKQWYLSSISAKEAWSKELIVKESRSFDRESVIAILDTGVDIDHPDIVDNIWNNVDENPSDGIDNDRNSYVDDVHGWDFISSHPDPNPKLEFGYNKDAVNHGTIVASVSAASGHNQEGVAGVSWRAKIMPLRVLDARGDGNVFNVVQAIDYAVKNGADVINMSFVGFDYSQALLDAITRAYNADVIVVAAAGNTDPGADGFNLNETKAYPICLDENNSENILIGVTSLGKDKKKSFFSNYGNNCIDISAPGEDFFAAQFYDSNVAGFNKYYSGYWSGTSLSTPLVSGSAALLKSIRPDLKNSQIIEILLNSSESIEKYNPDLHKSLGKGQLNLYQAVADAISYNLLPNERISSKSSRLVIGLGLGSFPQVKILNKDFSEFKAFFAYNPYFSGPVYVSSGDLDNDGNAEVVTGAGYGGGPHVRIFDQEGNVKEQFFAYDKNLRNGVQIAVGDVNGDGKDEIITGAGPGSPPEVKIFTFNGRVINNFFAYHQNFLGGVNLAVGDLDNDGNAEVVTGAGYGGGPHVRIFDQFGNVKGQFFAYNPISRNGVVVAVGDINNNSFKEIITGTGKEAAPVIKVFRQSDFFALSDFFAFLPNDFTGLNLASDDVDGDGIAEIIISHAVGGGPEVKIFDWRGTQKDSFFAFGKNYSGGARIGIMN